MQLAHWPIACLALAAGLEIVAAVLTATRLRVFFARPCALGLALASLWCVDYALDLSSGDYATKLLLLRLRMVFIPFYTMVWFEAAYRLVHQRRCLFGWRLAFASVSPAITTALSWFPSPTGVFVLFRGFQLEQAGPFQILHFRLGPWGIVFLGYAFSFAIASIAMLWSSLRDTRWGRSARWLLFGVLVVGIGLNALFAFRITPHLNYAPIFVPLGCGAVAYAMSRGRILHLGPVARSALIEDLEDMLVVIDSANQVVDLNRAAARSLGLRLEAAVGHSATEVLASWPEVLAALGRSAGTRVEVPVGRVPHELRIQGIPDARGEDQARILLLRNIVDRKRFEEQLRSAKESAEAADRAKSQFLAMISHEIRTPMNAVIGVAHLMQSTPINEEQRQYLELIQQGGRGLLVVIDDVLNYTKIISGRLELEESPCLTAELIAHTCNLLLPRAAAKGVALEWSVDPDVPPVILIDGTRMGQVLTNLIGNAVKFTEKGRIGLHVFRAGSARDLLAFAVSDTGIGIAPEALDRIFQPFSQADNSISRKFGGTGLGLAISKRLCEQMGGGLTVESAPGRGSTFTATVLAKTASSSANRASMAPGLEIAERRLRLLVIEDNRLNQRVLGALLKKQGHSTEFADSGQAGLDALERGGFDAVLMDIEMPDMDGYETVRRLRRREAEQGGRHHVIALTAHAMSGVREQCLSAGMDDYLTKPVDPVLLTDALRRCPVRER